MAVTKVPDWRAAADEVWAMMRETERVLKEQMQATDKRLEAQLRETDRRFEAQLRETERVLKEQMQASDRRFEEKMERTRAIVEATSLQIKKTARQLKESNRQLGDIGGRFGEVIECMIAPNLVKKFKKLGFEFENIYRNVEIGDKEQGIKLEVDAFLTNGDKVMIVEIKSKPKQDDISDHEERMKKLRICADIKNDKRKYFGAIAGVVFQEKVKDYALKRGFYVVEPSGDTLKITPPKDNRPREW